MRKLITSLFLGIGVVALPLGAYAEEVSQADALQKAISFNQQNSGNKRMAKATTMKMAYSVPSTTGVALYVFTPENGDGFTVVSGNDITAPILAYSDDGRFDSNNIPGNMAQWILSCQAIINEGIAQGVPSYKPSKTATTEKADIAKLVSTIWDQDAPFWNYCPGSGSKHKYTGCVATAMAQVMKKHNWPEKSHGTATWNNTTVTYKRTYKWDLMRDDYTASYTDDEATAVAELMYDCGTSVNMQYGYDASGANTDDVPEAMINIFDYDKGMTYIQSYLFTKEMWEDMMYYELQNGRPIIYGGFDTTYSAGHQYIADGYQARNGNSYFHINWGWSGYCDGFFLLTNLTPAGSGAGGNNGSYHTGADAVINIKPATDDTYVDRQLAGTGKFTIGTPSGDNINFKITSGSLWGQSENGFEALGGNNFQATLGIRLINVNDPANSYTVESSTKDKQFNRWVTKVASFNVNISDVPDGTYYVFPMSKATDTGEWTRIKCPYTKQQYVKLVRTNGSNAFSDPGTTNQFVPVIYILQEEYKYELKPGETVTLNPLVLPADADNTALSFSSADESVASVSAEGVISAKAAGETIVTMEAKDGSATKRSVRVIVNGSNAVETIDMANSTNLVDVYTTTGIRVLTNASEDEISNLPQGLYIAGGKKIIVK
jgi:hypothetical protein